MENPKTLSDWLAKVTLHDAEPPYNKGPKWFGVNIDGKSLALFPDFANAYSFRVHYIQRRMESDNPTE